MSLRRRIPWYAPLSVLVYTRSKSPEIVLNCPQWRGYLCGQSPPCRVACQTVRLPFARTGARSNRTQTAPIGAAGADRRCFGAVLRPGPPAPPGPTLFSANASSRAESAPLRSRSGPLLRRRRQTLDHPAGSPGASWRTVVSPFRVFAIPSDRSRKREGIPGGRARHEPCARAPDRAPRIARPGARSPQAAPLRPAVAFPPADPKIIRPGAGAQSGRGPGPKIEDLRATLCARKRGPGSAGRRQRFRTPLRKGVSLSCCPTRPVSASWATAGPA